MGTDSAVHHGTIDLIVGAIFVLFYAGNRFNTPSTNRSSTTAGRYFPAMSVYCVGATAAYFLLVNFPYLVTFIAQGARQDLPPFLKELSSPLVMALLMTVLLPKLPLLSSTDQWIREWLQGMAAIPHEVRRLSAELRNQPLTLAANVQGEVRQRLINDGFVPGDIRFDPGQEPAQMWTAVTALLLQLESWESDRKMAGYIQSYGETLKRIRERHEALIPKAKTCFKLLRQSGTAEETDKAREAVERYAEDFSDQVTNLSRDLFEFISRGILASELTDAARANRLLVLGFQAGAGRSIELTLNQMMSLFGVVGILVLSSFAMFVQTEQVSQGVLMARAAMISVIYSVAVACVVIPRQSWKFAQWEPGKMRPVAFYVAAALLAVAIAQVVSFGFNWALAGSFAAGVQRYRFTYPWCLMTFTTSVMTGFLIDNRPPAHIPRSVWRIAEGTLAACVMILVAVYTHKWLDDRVNFLGADLARSVKYFVPPLGAIIGPAGLVGFAIGYLVPAWFREAPRTPAVVPAAVLPHAVGSTARF